jgi:hypothetical protein
MGRLAITALALVLSIPVVALQQRSLDRPAEQDAGAPIKKRPASAHGELLTKTERLALIRSAQVWMPTNIPDLDLKVGPDGPGAFAPDETVTCDYVLTAVGGVSKKFDCAITAEDVVKVRYGATNGEVEGNVLGSRLLWALGFGADRVYPVVVVCRGCTADPFLDAHKVDGERVFKPAAIERKPHGHEMKAHSRGWNWHELALVDENQGGAPRAHIDALKLLAVFMQHIDSKPDQQRLICLPGGRLDDGTCTKPFLTVHDVGITFGRGTLTHATSISSVNFAEWSRTPVWHDAKKCVGQLAWSVTGTLVNPVISEAGRAFLAHLLVQLTDAQLHDLFEVAHVDQRNRKLNSHEGAASVDQWVEAFKRKRDEIVSARCPS